MGDQKALSTNQIRHFKAIMYLVFFTCMVTVCCLMNTAQAGNGSPIHKNDIRRPATRRGSGYMNIQYSVSGTCTTGNSITVTATASGGNGDYVYTFDLMQYDSTTDYLHSMHHMSEDDRSSVNSWTVPIYSPGEYYVDVQAWDSNGLFAYNGIDIENPIVVTGEDFTRKKSRELAQRFSAVPGDDYDKVLAAHDWLIANVEYDHSLLRHTAQNALMEGTGVCESYALAFQMIMEDMNIPSYFVTGVAPVENHAWNIAQINGKWYNIDCTWDDGSSLLYHLYFCLNDELISINHIRDEDSASLPACVSLEDNYYIRSEFIESWVESISWDINTAIYDKKTSFDIPYESILLEDGGYWHLSDSGNAISAALLIPELNSEPWHYEYEYYDPAVEDNVTESRLYNIEASFNQSDNMLHVNVNGILQGVLAEENLVMDNYEYPYAGIPVEAVFSVVYQDTVLQEDLDYTVLYENNTSVGQANIKIQGIGSYLGTIERTFEIVAGDISEAVLVLQDGPYTYAATEIKPLKEVRINDTLLEEGTDYTVSYQDNLHASWCYESGKATVTVTGCGNFLGEATRDFIINPRNITDRDIAVMTSTYVQVLSHSTEEGAIHLKADPFIPECISIEIQYNFYDLENGLEIYSEEIGENSIKNEFTENVETGECIHKIWLIDGLDYTYSSTSVFYRESIPISETDIWIVDRPKTFPSSIPEPYRRQHLYNGKSHVFTSPGTPTILTGIKPDGTGSTYSYYTLKEGQDYTVRYENNINAGQAKIIYTGIGMFSGEREYTFDIEPIDIQYLTMLIFRDSYIESGHEKKPACWLCLPSWVDNYQEAYLQDDDFAFTLYHLAEEGKDYTVSYQNHISAGTATVTLTGIGNYTGSISRNFTILPGGEHLCRIPESVDHIEAEAFAGTAFNEFILPNRPVKVDDGAFAGLNADTVQITIPNAQSEISRYAFNGIKNLTIIAPGELLLEDEYTGERVSLYCTTHRYTYESY